MKVSSSVLVLAAAIGASAHPSAHAQAHAAARRGFVVANKPVTVTEVVYANAQPTQAAPPVNNAQVYNAPSAAPTQEAKSDDSTKSKGKSSGTYKDFCGGKKSKRATTAQIAYKGNTGVEGQFGCNIMEVDESIADQYKYLLTFSNNVDQDQKCVCFNKIGPTGLINGFWKGNEAVSFDLPAKGKSYIALQENTQGGCTCGVGAVPYTSIGQFAGTWLEMDVGNESNGGWSGADASCLVASDAHVDIPALKVCGHNTCSTIHAGGAGENAYVAGTHDLDGVGLNIPAGQVRLEITVG